VWRRRSFGRAARGLTQDQYRTDRDHPHELRPSARTRAGSRAADSSIVSVTTPRSSRTQRRERLPGLPDQRGPLVPLVLLGRHQEQQGERVTEAELAAVSSRRRAPKASRASGTGARATHGEPVPLRDVRRNPAREAPAGSPLGGARGRAHRRLAG